LGEKVEDDSLEEMLVDEYGTAALRINNTPDWPQAWPCLSALVSQKARISQAIVDNGDYHLKVQDIIAVDRNYHPIVLVCRQPFE